MSTSITACFGKGCKLFAVVLAGALTVHAATPVLPAAVDGVVTLANQDYVLTEADDLTGITEFKTTGGWLVFDISENASMDVSAKVTGTGGLEKRGLGTLNLTCNLSNTDYLTTRGLHAVAGELHLPKKGSGEPQFGPINIDQDAIVFVSGHDTYPDVRTLFSNLTGSGLLTNGWNAAQILQQAQNTTSTNFSGVIGGKFNRIWIYPSASLHLTNTNSTFTVLGGSTFESNPGFGKLYVTKIGYDENELSSVGRTKAFTLGPNGGDNISGLYFMGTNGETTVKSLNFAPWSQVAATKKCVFDAGAGGITWNGNFTFTKQPMVHAVLQGDGAPTNVFGGAMSESSGSSYLEKRGAGTWFVKGNNGRKGVTDVKEGTFQFETLRDKGRQCSLGTSLLTHAAYCGAVDASRAVPYAFVLGGGAKGEATLECVGRDGNSVENQASDRPLVLAGAGRLKTTCPQPFALQGVSTIAATPCTLTLDGTNTASALIDVTNGTSTLSIAKDGAGTWILRGEQGFSGSLAVNEGTLVVEAPETPYTWYKLTIKTVNSFYTPGATDSCRVTYEFALYDANGIRRNKGLVSNTSQIPTALSPGQATVAADQIPNYYSWAFSNSTFLLSNMFDDNGGTASYLAGPNNGTSEWNWISVVMRLPAESPEITSFDMVSSQVSSAGTRRTVAYSVSGSTDGHIWDVLSEQTTNETARFTSGWYSNGEAFSANAVRQLPEKGIAIAPHRVVPAGAQLANVSSVTVASGATLEARGAVMLNTLSVDATAAGNGTVRGFSFAPVGVLDVTGISSFSGRLDVPFTFENCNGLENVAKWTLKLDGAPTAKYRAFVSPTGVSIVSRGVIIVFR